MIPNGDFKTGYIAGSILFMMIQLSVFRGIAEVNGHIGLWMKFEHSFISNKTYENPLYDIKIFNIIFKSPTGRIKVVNGFWDGDRLWKVRFAPDEKGTWTWESKCSDTTNAGLDKQMGSFVCDSNKNNAAIYKFGAIIHPKGSYHLSHANGLPFFWVGCTAWNGTLKSTDEEWDAYLADRSKKGYNVIQFVSTQWRGCDKNSLGQVAFKGTGNIKINPDFFRHLDGKIDKINEHGLIAAPVLLWALATVQGRDLSPGYYLPEEEAILLARYMVARYGGNQVIWILSGDGNYINENEQRWKNIGRAVFSEEHRGPVALHPGGSSWIGEAYAGETWLDIIGYQSGHSNSANAQNFINSGPVSKMWEKLPPRPIINMEPVYEEINPKITSKDIRNASYWSIMNAPMAGITYGANGLWPWLRDGEVILNHYGKGKDASRWYKAIDLPGSKQVGFLANFINKLDWWNLRPSNELLLKQPGLERPENFIAVSKSEDSKTILVYIPEPKPFKLHNFNDDLFEGRWFDPVANRYVKCDVIYAPGIIEIVPSDFSNDALLLLKKKE